MARTVELYIDGAWVDVTAGRYVLTEDAIAIVQGGDPQSATVNPGSATLTLYDRAKDGRWSNRVPTSNYYRKLGRNTPIRISVDGDVRAVMEVPKWDPRWNDAQTKVTVPIQAAGILRRLTQGAKVLRSPIRRYVETSSPAPFVYWPCEDDAGSTSAASALKSGAPMTTSGGGAASAGVKFGVAQGRTQPASTGFEIQKMGTKSFVSLGDGGVLAGRIPSGVSSAEWCVQFVAFSWAFTGVAGANIVLARWNTPGGSFIRWDVRQRSLDGGVEVVGFNSAAVETVLAETSFAPVDEFAYAVHVTQSGGNVVTDFWAARLTAAGGFGALDSDTRAGTLAAPSGPISLNSDGATVAHTAIAGSENQTNDIRAAHLIVTSGTPTFLFASAVNPATGDTYGPLSGWAGESAGARFNRLCAENGIAATLVGTASATAALGAQQIATLVDNLQAGANADQGLLYETRTELGLSYRTAVDLYNQYGPLVSYAAKLIRPPLLPTEDDRFIQNDVTVSRPDGSSARSVLETAVDEIHTLTTQDPPAGVGTYDRGSVTANVQSDGQLQLVADWIRHLGTWDELRYPTLIFEFASPNWATNAALAASLQALEVGDQLRLDDLPDWLPPDQVALMVRGSVEAIGVKTRTLALNLTPGWPWEVWQVDSGGSTLVAGVNSSATSLKLDTSLGPEWSTTAEPYYIQIDGEALTVTTMTTDTPAFIAAGTVAHGNNASVSPGLPAGMTPDVGQLMVLQAAIRNSGTGTVNTPTGWSVLAANGNLSVFGRYYLTGDTAPTVSFTGGVANADTSARIMAFSGLSMRMGGAYQSTLKQSPGTADQLNGSAQDIAYPALYVFRDNCVVFYLGWKQDDWTSVATLAGATEDFDNATTTGDDQGIVADHVIQTSHAAIAAGSFTVTGGASAISRATLFALRPLQTATVTRSVNGVSKSLAAGKAVHGWRLGVNGL